jgi:dinuclear metal center YbgI/SA1388 family protein
VSTPVSLDEVADYLDGYLSIREIPDEAGAVNGLQVENGSRLIERIVAAVDISQATIDGVVGAGQARNTLLIVHHGLLWDGNIAVTGRRYRRLRALFDHEIAVYAAHIPLDVHPEVGNNVGLATSLGCVDLAPFDSYKGIALGVRGRFPEPMARSAVGARLNAILETESRLIPGGPELIRTIGVITGGAGSRIRAARDAGLDGFVTGEGAHHTFFDAMEYGINVFYAGHYATEQVGVQALARHLSERFALPWEFHRHPTGL